MPQIKRQISSKKDNKGKSALEQYQAEFLKLDYKAGEGLNNPIFPLLKKTPLNIFERSINFILENCINVNRSFSDAVEFLSIWLKKSPHRLLIKLENISLIKELIKELKKESKNETRIMELKNKIRIKELEKKLEKKGLTESEKTDRLINKLEQSNLNFFFNRTEYSHEGDQWYFPKLLKIFEVLVNKTNSAGKILNYVFEVFDFFNIPNTFVVEIIGYDRLQKCIEECPPIFKQVLVLKINMFVKLHKTINLGLQSQKFLNEEVKKIQYSPTVSKGLSLKNNIFASPLKNSKCSKEKEEDLSHKSHYFRWSNSPFNFQP